MDGPETCSVARHGRLTRRCPLGPGGAAGQLVAILVLAFGLVALHRQAKVVPYVVEVDQLGAVQALRPAAPAHLPPDDRFLRYLLRSFFQGARAILRDPVAMQRTLDGVYTHARGPARAFLDDYYRAHDPFQLADRYTAAATVQSLLPLSETSWRHAPVPRMRMGVEAGEGGGVAGEEPRPAVPPAPQPLDPRAARARESAAQDGGRTPPRARVVDGGPAKPPPTPRRGAGCQAAGGRRSRPGALEYWLRLPEEPGTARRAARREPARG